MGGPGPPVRSRPMGNERGFRHRRRAPLDDPAPGDPNAAYASILQRATQEVRREQPVAYRRTRVVYLVVLGVPVAALIGYVVTELIAHAVR